MLRAFLFCLLASGTQAAGENSQSVSPLLGHAYVAHPTYTYPDHPPSLRIGGMRPLSTTSSLARELTLNRLPRDQRERHEDGVFVNRRLVKGRGSGLGEDGLDAQIDQLDNIVSKELKNLNLDLDIPDLVRTYPTSNIPTRLQPYPHTITTPVKPKSPAGFEVTKRLAQDARVGLANDEVDPSSSEDAGKGTSKEHTRQIRAKARVERAEAMKASAENAARAAEASKEAVSQAREVVAEVAKLMEAIKYLIAPGGKDSQLGRSIMESTPRRGLNEPFSPPYSRMPVLNSTISTPHILGGAHPNTASVGLFGRHHRKLTKGPAAGNATENETGSGTGNVIENETENGTGNETENGTENVTENGTENETESETGNVTTGNVTTGNVTTGNTAVKKIGNNSSSKQVQNHSPRGADVQDSDSKLDPKSDSDPDPDSDSDPNSDSDSHSVIKPHSPPSAATKGIMTSKPGPPKKETHANQRARQDADHALDQGADHALDQGADHALDQGADQLDQGLDQMPGQGSDEGESETTEEGEDTTEDVGLSSETSRDERQEGDHGRGRSQDDERQNPTHTHTRAVTESKADSETYRHDKKGFGLDLDQIKPLDTSQLERDSMAGTNVRVVARPDLHMVKANKMEKLNSSDDIGLESNTSTKSDNSTTQSIELSVKKSVTIPNTSALYRNRDGTILPESAGDSQDGSQDESQDESQDDENELGDHDRPSQTQTSRHHHHRSKSNGGSETVAAEMVGDGELDALARQRRGVEAEAVGEDAELRFRSFRDSRAGRKASNVDSSRHPRARSRRRRDDRTLAPPNISLLEIDVSERQQTQDSRHGKPPYKHSKRQNKSESISAESGGGDGPSESTLAQVMDVVESTVASLEQEVDKLDRSSKSLSTNPIYANETRDLQDLLEADSPKFRHRLDVAAHSVSVETAADAMLKVAVDAKQEAILHRFVSGELSHESNNKHSGAIGDARDNVVYRSNKSANEHGGMMGKARLALAMAAKALVKARMDAKIQQGAIGKLSDLGKTCAQHGARLRDALEREVKRAAMLKHYSKKQMSGYRRSLSRASTALAKAKAGLKTAQRAVASMSKHLVNVSQSLRTRSEEVLQERLARSKAQIEADQMAQKEASMARLVKEKEKSLSSALSQIQALKQKLKRATNNLNQHKDSLARIHSQLSNDANRLARIDAMREADNHDLKARLAKAELDLERTRAALKTSTALLAAEANREKQQASDAQNTNTIMGKAVQSLRLAQEKVNKQRNEITRLKSNLISAGISM
ncbi:hypothetical protein AAMO2058_001679500 [Amorphochlora amoebiformis]